MKKAKVSMFFLVTSLAACSSKGYSANTYQVIIIPPEYSHSFSSCVDSVEYDNSQYVFDSVQKIKCVTHRGLDSIAPENTLPSIELARKKGFRYFECDVRYTLDGTGVLLHDETLNRTARLNDGSELEAKTFLKDLTYDQASSYDYGLFFSQDYLGTRLPTLEEVLCYCRMYGLHPYLEIAERFSADNLENFVNTIRTSGMSEDVTVISYYHATLKSFTLLMPKVTVGYAQNLDNGFDVVLDRLCDLKTGENEVFYSANKSAPNAKIVNDLIKNGLSLGVSVIETKEEGRSMNSYVTHAITTGLHLSDFYDTSNLVR